MAAAGAWVGLAALPALLLLGCLTALAMAAATTLARAKRRPAEEPIAFGPHLCLATWVVWLYGPPAIY
jgi:leader peptidase (prepilin peptidase)/N-methyltransferase